MAGVALGGYGLAALYLGTNWYAGEELSPFHFFDDRGEWLQVDKFGHAMGAYQASRWMIGLYKWSGTPKKEALWIGGLSGFLALSSVEVLDGFGKKWGFSWSDIGANFVGSALAVGNQALWNEDRLQLKVAWQPSPYARVDSLQDLFGSTWPEWLLKDYNGHSLWLSCRVHSFLPEGSVKRIWPRWLNIAVGYGAEGMIGGYGSDPPAAIAAREYRQYYLGLDLDLAGIKTRSGLLHTLLNVASIIRIPAPALRWDRNGWKPVIE